jgi:hypothetical protein
MKAGDSATTRHADQRVDRAKDRSNCRANSSGAMALQSDRVYDAAPQMFVQLTGSHPARPRASSKSRSVAATG